MPWFYSRMDFRRYACDVAVAGAWAAVLGGVPSTLYALATGGDALEATRAAGAMLVPADSPTATLVAAALVAHLAVNFGWTAILVAALPRRHVVAWAVAAAILIAIIDLRIVATLFFPEVWALAFGPQLADHLAWGATLGVVLQRRFRYSVNAR